MKKLLLALAVALGLRGAQAQTPIFACNFDGAGATVGDRFTNCATAYGLTAVLNDTGHVALGTGFSGQGMDETFVAGQSFATAFYHSFPANTKEITMVWQERFSVWPGSQGNSKDIRLYNGGFGTNDYYLNIIPAHFSDDFHPSNWHTGVATVNPAVVSNVKLGCGCPGCSGPFCCWDGENGCPLGNNQYTTTPTNGEQPGRLNFNWAVNGRNLSDLGWHKLRMYTKLPTTGAATDGKMTLWIDDVQVYDMVNVGRLGGGDSYTYLSWFPAEDGNVSYHHYIDEIQVYSGLIPPGAADTTAPSQVTGASATAASSTQINVAWSAATDNIGVTGYRVERCPLAGCSNFLEVGSVGAVLNFNDGGLAPSTLYRYRVRAQDAAGNLGAYSSTVEATTQALQVYCPAGGACSNEPACATAAFCEDWEDGNHIGWDWDSSWDACTTIVGAGGFNSTNALKHHINTNACECGYPGTNLSLSAQTNPVFMRFYVKYSPGYQFFSNEIIGEKLIYFRSLVGGSSVWRNEMAVGSKNGAGDRSLGHINVDDGTHDVWWFQNINLPEKTISSGQWYCIEWEIKANTPSQANGFFKVWLDDTQIMDVNNVNLNSTGDPIVMAPWISEYYGGNPCQTHQAQDIWYDQIVTSRQRIGCAGTPPPTAVCGNGIPETGEACDDGNTVTETACAYGTPSCVQCNATCSQVLNLTGPYCGDNLVTNGEFCDGTNLGGHSCAEFGCSSGSPTCVAGCGSVSTSTCSNCGLAPIAMRQVLSAEYGSPSCTGGPAGFGVNVLANSLIVVAIRGGVINPPSSHVYTVTDNRGNVYREAVRGNMAGDTAALTIFYATNPTAQSVSVTVTDVVCGSMRVAFFEYTGTERGGGALDAQSWLQEDNSATLETAPLQTQAQGDLVMALFSVSGTATFSGGAGFVVEAQVPAAPNAKMAVMDALVPTINSSVTVTATIPSAQPWGGVAVAFRPPVVTVPPAWRAVRGVVFK